MPKGKDFPLHELDVEAALRAWETRLHRFGFCRLRIAGLDFGGGGGGGLAAAAITSRFQPLV